MPAVVVAAVATVAVIVAAVVIAVIVAVVHPGVIVMVALELHVDGDRSAGGEHVAGVVDELHDDLVRARDLYALAETPLEVMRGRAGVRVPAGVPVDEQDEVSATSAAAALSWLGEFRVLDLHLELEAVVAVAIVVLVLEFELVVVLGGHDH